MPLVGVQHSGFTPVIVGPVGATTVTIASTDTACFTPAAALIAPSNDTWVYTVQVNAVVTCASTTGTALVFKLKNGAGTTLDTYTVEPTILANSAVLALSFTLVSTASASLYWPTGDTPSVTGASATHNATLSANTRAVFSFVYVGD